MHPMVIVCNISTAGNLNLSGKKHYISNKNTFEVDEFANNQYQVSKGSTKT